MFMVSCAGVAARHPGPRVVATVGGVGEDANSAASIALGEPLALPHHAGAPGVAPLTVTRPETVDCDGIGTLKTTPDCAPNTLKVVETVVFHVGSSGGLA